MDFYFPGTNKSAALSTVLHLIEELEGDHIFECGTLEGLMKSMVDNNETMLGTYDEFATFIDGLDKGMWLFIFYPGCPAGCILTGIQTIYPVFRLGYETFCKLAYGGYGTIHFFNTFTFIYIMIQKCMEVQNIFDDVVYECETFQPVTKGVVTFLRFPGVGSTA